MYILIIISTMNAVISTATFQTYDLCVQARDFVKQESAYATYKELSPGVGTTITIPPTIKTECFLRK